MLFVCGKTLKLNMNNSDDDESINMTPRTKRRISSSEEDDTATKIDLDIDTQSTVRSSERIKTKRNRVFHLPSREERWKDIPSTKSPIEELKKIRPIKAVNNFTRETHYYNCDRNPGSGDDSDFIDDEDSSNMNSSQDSQEVIYEKRKRVKNKCHRRLMMLSDSESDDEVTNKTTSTCHSSENFTESGTNNQISSTDLDNKKRGNLSLSVQPLHDLNGDSDHDLCAERQKSCVHVSSGSDSDDSLCSTEETIQPVTLSKLRGDRHDSVLISSDDTDSKEESTCGRHSKRVEQQSEVKQKRKEDLFKDLKARRAARSSRASSSTESKEK